MPDFLALVVFAIFAPYLAYDIAKVFRRGRLVWRPQYGTRILRYSRRDNPVEFWLYLACEGILCAASCAAIIMIVLNWVRR